MQPTNSEGANLRQPRPLPSTDAPTINLSLFPGFTEFFTAYIGAALWASTDEESGESLDRNYGAGDIDPDSFATLQAHALSFWTRALVYLSNEGDATWKDAGHDFWLTQNRHGSGFWDGSPWLTYGDTLTELSHCYPELHLSVEEGVIYVYPA